MLQTAGLRLHSYEMRSTVEYESKLTISMPDEPKLKDTAQMLRQQRLSCATLRFGSTDSSVKYAMDQFSDPQRAHESRMSNSTGSWIVTPDAQNRSAPSMDGENELRAEAQAATRRSYVL